MSKNVKPIICPFCNSIYTYIRNKGDYLEFYCGSCNKRFYSEDLSECMQVDDDVRLLYDAKTKFVDKFEDVDGINYTVFTSMSDSGHLINMLMEEELNKGVNYKKLAFYSFMDNNL